MKRGELCGSGLENDANLEQFERSNVREFVGRVTATHMVEIERALILFFGIAE